LKQAGGDRVPFNKYDRGGVDTLTSVDPANAAFKLVSPLYFVITP
jgi:hypothetical protein